MTDVKTALPSPHSALARLSRYGVKEDRAFYDDPVKCASDADSARVAEYVLSFATDRGMVWRARRLRAYLRSRIRSVLRVALLSRPWYRDYSWSDLKEEPLCIGLARSVRKSGLSGFSWLAGRIGPRAAEERYAQHAAYT